MAANLPVNKDYMFKELIYYNAEEDVNDAFPDMFSNGTGVIDFINSIEIVVDELAIKYGD